MFCLSFCRFVSFPCSYLSAAAAALLGPQPKSYFFFSFIDFQELKAVCIGNETKVARAARNNLLTLREAGLGKNDLDADIECRLSVSMNQVNGLEPFELAL